MGKLLELENDRRTVGIRYYFDFTAAGPALSSATRAVNSRTNCGKCVTTCIVPVLIGRSHDNPDRAMRQLAVAVGAWGFVGKFVQNVTEELSACAVSHC